MITLISMQRMLKLIIYVTYTINEIFKYQKIVYNLR